MTDKQTEELAEIHQTLRAGLIVLIAEAIQTRKPKEEFTQCLSEAFVQFHDTRQQLDEGPPRDEPA